MPRKIIIWVILALFIILTVHAISNPAAVYCSELGYESRIVMTDNGQEGICYIPEADISFDEWGFFTGKVGQEYSYCAKQGYEEIVLKDGNNPYSREYAACKIVSNDTYKQENDSSMMLTTNSNVLSDSNLSTSVVSVVDLMHLKEILDNENNNIQGLQPKTAIQTNHIFEVQQASIQSLPSSFDWQNYNGYNWLTSTKDQGVCGSCWAFATVAGVESNIKIDRNQPDLNIDLSEEYLVSDCSDAGTCMGGGPSLALNYIKNYGITDESCFPYVDGGFMGLGGCSYSGDVCGGFPNDCTYKTNGACSDATCSDRCSDWSQRLTKIYDYQYIGSNIDDMKRALINYGPLPITLYIDGSFQDLDGIYRCGDPPYSGRHAVLLIGYKDDASKPEGGYWIIRNSWGWLNLMGAEVGYGQCDIGYAYAIYPSKIDFDNDGLPDYNDACPTTYGTYCHGCPQPSCGTCKYAYCPSSGAPYCNNYGSEIQCNPNFACSFGVGNNYYNIGGEYSCQGYCDGSGNCDYADSCSYSVDCDPDDDNDGVCDPGKSAPTCTGVDNCINITGPLYNNGCPDTTPPNITIHSPINGSVYNTSNISVNIMLSEQSNLFVNWFSNNGSYNRNNTEGESFVIENLEEGNHTLFVKVIDRSNNSANKTVDFEVDILTCIDRDQDNYFEYDEYECPEGNDCDDSNLTINPIAIEECNGVDDNCNNQTDEGYTDYDNDKIADCVDTDDDNDGDQDISDCAPNDSNIYDGAEEICNGLDDDCDGYIDGNLTRNCGSGSCSGNQTCKNGNWSLSCSSYLRLCGTCTLCDEMGQCNMVDENCSCQIPKDGMVITSSKPWCNGAYSLPNGVSIGSNNIILNCNRSTLIGNIPSYSVGISTYLRNNITIKNCILINYSVGISLLESNNSLVINNTITNNNYPGAEGLLVANGANRNRIEKNIIKEAYYGSTLGDGSIQNIFSGNYFFQNDATGIIIQIAQWPSFHIDRTIRDNVIINNTFSENHEGIMFMYSSSESELVKYNNVTKNVFSNQTWVATVFGGQYNKMWDNHFYHDNLLAGSGSNDSYCVNLIGNHYHEGATGPSCNIDGDNFYDYQDCNDLNSLIYPGAPELCNGIDDDCDGQIDEGLSKTYYQDADSDTYGNIAESIYDCIPPNGYVLDDTDCNDTNSSIYPGAPEIPCDGIDQDCNGYDDCCMAISSPQDTVYNSRYIPFNISLFGKSDYLSYKEMVGSREITRALCRNCDEYGSKYRRIQTFGEGQHNISFINPVCEENVSFFVDSYPPRIYTTAPLRGFADGSFMVQFIEQNPETILLHYGGSEVYDEKIISLDAECAADRGITTCNTYVDISPYDPGKIEYWFEVIDIAGASAESRHIILAVDTVPPEILNFEKIPKGAYVDFELEVNEPNFLSAEYFDHNSTRAVWTRLCYSLRNNICAGRARFYDGEHNLSIRVLDKAGNENNLTNITFFTDSMPPRILSYSPTRGFADGTFTVKFIEQNPVSLMLNYGNNGDYDKEPLDLENNCAIDRGTYTCETHVNLSAYDPGSVEYWFELKDRAGASAASRKTALQVDTTPPEILNTNIQPNGAYVKFELEISEQNFLSAQYYEETSPYPRWTSLCNRLVNGMCAANVRFYDGNHSLKITIKDKAGNNNTIEEITFFTDSIKPVISRTEPIRGYANGTFSIIYTEENCMSLELNISSPTHSLGAIMQCDSSRNVNTQITKDISGFNGEIISYTFNLTDIVNSSASRTVRNLMVDTTPPVIANFNYSISWIYVTFNITVEETNFDSVKYMDLTERIPVYRVLCNRLDKNNNCIIRKYFSRGQHNLTVSAIDKAGNQETRNINFNVNY